MYQEMNYELPPGVGKELLAHIPFRHREDAVGEAWVGFLEAERDGGNPIKAAQLAAGAYKEREIFNEKRHLSPIDLSNVPDKINKPTPEEMGLHFDQYHGWIRDDT